MQASQQAGYPVGPPSYNLNVPSQVHSELSQKQLPRVPSDDQPAVLPLPYEPQREYRPIKLQICCCHKAVTVETLRLIILGHAAFLTIYGVISLIVASATAISASPGTKDGASNYSPLNGLLNHGAFLFGGSAPAYILIIIPILLELTPGILMGGASVNFQLAYAIPAMILLWTGIAVETFALILLFIYILPLPRTYPQPHEALVPWGLLFWILKLTLRGAAVSTSVAIMQQSRRDEAMRAWDNNMLRSTSAMHQEQRQVNNGELAVPSLVMQQDEGVMEQA